MFSVQLGGERGGVWPLVGLVGGPGRVWVRRGSVEVLQGDGIQVQLLSFAQLDGSHHKYSTRRPVPVRRHRAQLPVSDPRARLRAFDAIRSPPTGDAAR